MKPKSTLRYFLLAAGSSLLAISSTSAGQIWDGGSLADNNWSTADNWDSNTLPTFSSAITFAGIARATNVNDLAADTTIGGINFTNTTAGQAFSISGARITLGGNITTTASSGAGITDTVSFAMILNGNREINTGALHNLTLSGIISETGGARTLTKSGTGTLTLSGDNSYTGVTTISAGNLVISHNNALGTTAGNTTITAAGTGPRLLLSGGINSAENISINGTTETGSFNNVIASTSGTNTLSGTITLANPSNGIRLGTNGGNLILAGTINQTGTARTLILNANSGNIALNTAISNGGQALSIISQGTSGSVTINTAQNTGIGAVSIGEGGTLKLGINDAIRTNQNLTIGFNFSNTADRGTFDLAGFNQTVNALTGTPASSSPSASSTRIVTNSAASGTSTLTVGNGNGSGTFNGVINDGTTAAVALAKTGTGTLTLVGDSNYSGVTTISGGIIAISHSNALGSTAGNTTIAATGAGNGPQLNLSGGINSPENITITGATENSGFNSAILNTSGNNTLSGNITLSNTGGGIRLGSNGGSLTFSGNLSQTTTSNQLAFFTSGTGSIIVDNAIANRGGALLVYGTGAGVTLKGVSGSGIGDTAINQGGTLNLGVTNALNTSADLAVGQDAATTNTFNLASFNQTVKGLTSGGTGTRRVINSVASTTSTLTVGNGGGNFNFSGVILNNAGTGGTVALVKTGTGNQTLSGINTFTGGTRIDDGTLTLGHATDTLANTGAVNVNGGTLALGTNTDTVGAVTLTSGSITGSGAGTLTGASYDVRSGSVSAILAGSGIVLTKSTTGTVILSGANTYTGATNINEGTLQLDGSTASGSTVAIGTAGTLTGTGNVLGNATLTGGGIINKSSGTISGTLGVTGGNWNGNGTVTGLVTSSSGTFTIGTGANLTATNGVSLTGGGMVINGTLTGNLTANSSTTVSGSGTVTGTATINGTLSPGNSPGTMTYTNTLSLAGTTIMEIDGNAGAGVTGGHDFVNLTGTGSAGVLTYGGTMTLDIGTIFAVGTFSWNLFNFESETATFTSINLADQYSGSLVNGGSGIWGLTNGNNTWQFTESTGVLGLTVIPEPRAALLGGIGLLLLLRRRR